MTHLVNKWYVEPILPSLIQHLELTGYHYKGRTAFQDVEIVETAPFGITILLDGKTQSAQGDEFIYHEALVHPALVMHPSPKTVFIGGGGEGATLREVLAHKTVERAVMVDLDGEFVRLCKERLPTWHQGAFEDPRATVLHEDARKYLQDYQGKFDVIIMDVTDPSEGGPSYLLYTESFYRMAAERLSPGGVIVTQAGPASLNMVSVLTAVANTMRSAVGNAFPYRANMLSFGSDWGFVLSRRAPAQAPPLAMSPEEIDRRLARGLTRELRFYSGAAHHGAFGIPKWLQTQVQAETRLITDDNPIFYVNV